MAYTKPQIVAQNSSTGSYAASCPADSGYSEQTCYKCDRAH